MPAVVRPRREFSFADWSKTRPREPIPGDRLDAQFENLIEAIHSTQRLIADLRRDDGGLRNQSVGLEQLKATVHDQFTRDVAGATAAHAFRAEQGAAVVKASERTTALFAKDAEAAAISAAQFLSAVNAAQQLVEQNNHRITTLADVTEAEATDAENWAAYAKAQADNAIKAKEEALAWAEYLAGPVVDAADAPAYIADSAFPHGLYYQPVEGYGGVAGLWSAKWWAVYAAQLVGPWGFYYLGGWPSPPLPGADNPDTGIKVPNPLAPGSIYYDTNLETIFVWNGSEWTTPYSLASGAVSRFVYLATAGQTAFSGADTNGATPDVGLSPSDVHLNGVRLVETVDFTIDTASSTLTLVNIAAAAGAVIQWDLLVPPDDLVPGNVHTFKVALTPGAPDGATTAFTMQYTHPVGGPQPVNVTDGSQLQVSLDGVIQEPGFDYTAADNTLTLAVAPRADARLWVVWFSNAVLTR
jgi:hypothetical protein